MKRKRKTQTAWAIVNCRGYIHHFSLRYNRRDVIADQVKEWRTFGSMVKHADKTDAQFWRLLKRRRNVSVRRVVLQVAK